MYQAAVNLAGVHPPKTRDIADADSILSVDQLVNGADAHPSKTRDIADVDSILTAVCSGLLAVASPL